MNFKVQKIFNNSIGGLIIIFSLVLYSSHYACAGMQENEHIEWSLASDRNSAICNAPGQQSAIQVIGDGEGGAIITWEDTRDTHFDIYAQRLDRHGNILWEENGVPICTAEENQKQPQIISDGAGGGIIVWQDMRHGIANSDIYAQRVNAEGGLLWEENGIPVCFEINAQNSPSVVVDGSGGAIIAWQDYRTNYADLYAQRIDKDGKPQWKENGILVCGFFGAQSAPVAADDGAGGAIIVWPDFRKSFADIYAQRIDGSGKLLWDRTGALVCGARGHESFPEVINNGAEGAIITWIDMRNDNKDIFAQQLDGNGEPLWITDGIAVCTVPKEQNYPVIVTDGGGGAIIAWWDMRSGKYDVYAQHVDLTGKVLWEEDGLPVCVESGIQNHVSITNYDSGGAILAWNDDRASLFDIYAQKIDSEGNMQWSSNGIPVCTANDTQCYSAIASDDEGGAIVVWQDGRNKDKSYWDIYAQKINEKGLLGD